MNFEICDECRLGFKPIKINTDTGIFSDNACTKCGKTIREACTFCNGTGEITDISKIGLRCSRCNNLLERKKKCHICSGSGKIFKYHVCSNPLGI